MDNSDGYHYMCVAKSPEGKFLYSKRCFWDREVDKSMCEHYDEFFENPKMKTSISKNSDMNLIFIVFRNEDIALGFVNGMWFSHEKDSVWDLPDSVPAGFEKPPEEIIDKIKRSL